MIESAISLIIMGIVIGILMGPVLSMYRQYQYRQTKENQERIIQQIAFFITKNARGSLPCPDDPKNPGVMVYPCNGKKAIGIVPFRLLGLPERVAKDGFGRWITYVVNPPSTDHHGGGKMTSRRLCEEIFKAKQKLNVIDKNGKDVLAAFALISHGPSGRGSFSVKGDKSGPFVSDSKCKQQNCIDELSLCLEPQPSDTGTFDDTVRAVSIDEIFGIAGVKCLDQLQYE